MNLTDLIVREV